MGESTDMSDIKKFIIAIYDDEEKVLAATQKAHQNGIPIHDVYTPYAVHGLDEAMGIKRSRLSIVCFIAASFGCLLAIGFQLWVSSVSWPLNVGGKPFQAIPAFIPVTFELTVLIGGLVTTAAFLLRSRLLPGASPLLLDRKITDNRFVIAVAKTDASLDEKKVSLFFLKEFALEVHESEVIE